MLLDQKLSRVFGADRVFRSSRSITGSTPFRPEIVTAASECSIMISLIGPLWLAADDSGTRRIDRPGDWVRLELELAIAQERPILPVLVGGIRLPAEIDLPPSIESLAGRQYTRLHHRSAERDLAHIVDQVREVIGPAFTGHAAPKPEESVPLTSLKSTGRSGDVTLGTAQINGHEYIDSIIYRSTHFPNGRTGSTSYNLGMRFRKLEVTVAVLDDAADARQTGHFEVFVDGRKREGVAVVQGRPRVLVVDVTDALNLQLVARRTDVVGSPMQAGANIAVGVPNNLPELAWGNPMLHP
ncbi:TIR domain-containing protein [Saccharothrix sp. NRRL B-16314]|uniref:TIR domain-containing protein n=1 Tax=Saccharothrix sp. NRRL B-16314 TaxID=1463825 RepID=UPI000689A10D